MPEVAARRTPRRAITGRALVLGTLVVLMLVVLASPLQRYFSSRNDRGHAAQQLRQDQQQLANLAQQQRRWSDPGYVQQQARVRLLFAMPGDTVYVVVNPGQKSDIQRTEAASAAPQVPSWNERLWRSVQIAGS